MAYFKHSASASEHQQAVLSLDESRAVIITIVIVAVVVVAAVEVVVVGVVAVVFNLDNITKVKGVSESRLGRASGIFWPSC